MAHVLETSSLVTLEIPNRLKALGIRSFVPVYAREVHHARRVERRYYPLYGRYAFAWFNAGEFRTVLKCKGVVGVLRKAGSISPASVDDALVDAISTYVEKPNFTVGEELQVVGGYWQGLKGLFSRVENERIMLMLSMLGKEVELPFEMYNVCTRQTQAEV